MGSAPVCVPGDSFLLKVLLNGGSGFMKILLNFLPSAALPSVKFRQDSNKLKVSLKGGFLSNLCFYNRATWEWFLDPGDGFGETNE